MVDALIYAGADVNAECWACEAALQAGVENESSYAVALRNGHPRVLSLLLRHGAVPVDAFVARTRDNESAFLLHDKVIAAGGYENFLTLHRRILSRLILKFFSSKFGREAPRDVCVHVASFSSALPR